jgi:hypothetical protein
MTRHARIRGVGRAERDDPSTRRYPHDRVGKLGTFGSSRAGSANPRHTGDRAPHSLSALCLRCSQPWR